VVVCLRRLSFARQIASPNPHRHRRHADSDHAILASVASLPPHPLLFLAMPFDTVVLNDGTNVRLSPSFPCSLSYRIFTVPGPCVRDRNQIQRNCKLRDFLVALLMTCPPYDRRTLRNTWSKPLRQASSTSIQLPVTPISVTPAGQQAQSNF